METTTKVLMKPTKPMIASHGESSVNVFAGITTPPTGVTPGRGCPTGAGQHVLGTVKEEGVGDSNPLGYVAVIV